MILYNPQRTIVHMDLDSFFVSVECLKNSSLLGKPLAVGGSGDRGVVASCSYEARRFGVRSAMPMKMARQLCPDLMVIRGDMEMYSKYSAVITEILSEKAPVLEKSSIDEFYLDISGMDRFFGCFKWTHQLRESIMKETGLPLSFGLSVNKLVSKIGTGEAKPNGEKEVPRGTERDFLAPLSIKKIPMIGGKTYTFLRNMGVEKVSTLREMPVDLLEMIMGKNGKEVWKRAHGIDETPVEPYNEQKSISTENTFQDDTIDICFLRSVLCGMAEKVAFQLRAQAKVTSCITVKIRYSDFQTVTRQVRVGYTAADHVIIQTVLDLFERLYERRLLIRLVGVRLSGLVHGNYQINLFEDTGSTVNLYQAMDKIRNKYGSSAVKRASGFG